MPINGHIEQKAIDPLEGQSFSDVIDHWSKQECWRPIKDFDQYWVSSFGRVKGKRVDVLIQGEAHGYKIVSLMKNGRSTTKRVSRLVLTAFIGDPPFDGAHAAHNDGDKSNNNISNLRWSNAFENQADIDRHNNRRRGSRVNGAKLTESDIPTIKKRIENGEKYPTIANDYGVSVSSISLIGLNKTWTHVASATE